MRNRLFVQADSKQLAHLESGIIFKRGQAQNSINFTAKIMQIYMFIVSNKSHSDIIFKIIDKFNNRLFDRIELFLLQT
jgi:hypothetical protein